MPFERYKSYSRMQESGELYYHYRTTLRQLAERCEFESITPNQILRDKLVFLKFEIQRFVRGFFVKIICPKRKRMRFVALMRPRLSVMSV